MTGDERACILHLKMTLRNRFAQVAELRCDRHDRGDGDHAKSARVHDRRRSETDEQSADKAADGAGPGLVRRELRRELRSAEEPTAGVSADVARPDNRK